MSGAKVMREKELRAVAVCAFCRKPSGSQGSMVFYRLSVESWMANSRNIARQHGLGELLCSAALAEIMGPDLPMADCFAQGTATACMECALDPRRSLAELLEAATAAAEVEAAP